MYRLKFYSLPYEYELRLQNMYVLLSLCCAIFILSGCARLSNKDHQGNLGGTAQVKFEAAADKTDMIILPPGINNRPLQPGQSGTPMMSNGLPALQALKGVKVEQLFSQNIRDTDKRFARLENVVLDLRREFEAVKPSIIRLVAVEEDIQQLIDALEVTLSNEPVRAPMEPSIMPVSTAPPNPTAVQSPMQIVQEKQPIQINPTVATMTTPQTNGALINDIRFGLHDGFVRIVIDSNQETPHSIELDNQEQIMLIQLPEAHWEKAATKELYKSPLIKSYTVQTINDGGGIQVIMQLKKPTKILRDKAIPPGTNPKFRIFIDIAD